MTKRTATWMTLAVLSCGVCRAAEWKPADCPLMTRWAADVSPDRVWTEYPRPQMVRKEWINLNGLWKYAIRPKADPQPALWDGQILVPFALESALSGVMKSLNPDQRLWYRRTFQAPGLPDNPRTLLHLGAVDWQCTVWVNDRQVGEHTGGYDPFTLDITDAVRPGENEVVVSVWDPTDTGTQPHGKQVLKPDGIMYTAVSGIWQTVWLESVPGDYIQSLFLVPNVDQGLIAVTVRASADAEIRLAAKEGHRTVAQGIGQAGKVIELKIQNAKLWSPDHPNLYDLEVSLVRGGKVLDAVTSYFGMRKIEVRTDAAGIPRLMLNNQILFQYGLLDQGRWPDGLYTPATDEAMKYDIVITKKFGMNMARKHVKVEPACWYAWCDRLGLLVWQDIPSGDSGRSDESKANFRRELKAMIDGLHNFPCIVMWVLFNEGWGQHDTPEIVKWIQDYDPTRPVNEASGLQDNGEGQVSDMHSYPGPGMRPMEDRRVSVLGGFGGLGMPMTGHTWQAEKNWGYVSFKTAADLTDAYIDLLSQMRLLIGKGLSAAVYTQTSDVEIEVNGLMTYDRTVVKMDLDRIADAARKLYLPPPVVRSLVPTSEVQAQAWRYTTEKPAEDWFKPGFNEASWKSGPGGFGDQGTPGVSIRTEWKTPDIWLRRSFSIDTVPAQGDLILLIHHDEDAEVYLNGRLARQIKGFVGSYGQVVLPPAATSTLKVGPNTLAVHCRQTTGGHIDVGLAVLVDKPLN